MSTPGRRKALRALGRAKARNRRRYISGKKTAIVGGKKVKMSTLFKKIGGKPKSWKKKK